jgi:hypothetical protein
MALLLLVVPATPMILAAIPVIPGLEVIAGDSVLLPTIDSPLAFQFQDGRIVVGKAERSVLSVDGGRTWKKCPPGPGDKVAIDLGGGEILSIGRKSERRLDGRFTLRQQRSRDGWQTSAREEGLVSMPEAGSTVVGDGEVIDGFLFHHGILQLPDGKLIGTMYGNNRGDTALCDGYPPELGQRKYRTVVVFSDDRGRSWGNPVLVAYDRMLGRGIPDGHPLEKLGLANERTMPTAVVPAITQEGFREAGLTIAPNGDLLCVMRSGGRNGGSAVLFPTPLYCSRSSDGGRTWTPPAQIADRGVCPNLVTLRNGIIVCTYSRPGNWLIFSDDNGKNWKGAFQFGSTGAYNYLAAISADTVQVFHEVRTEAGTTVRGSFFTLKKQPL